MTKGISRVLAERNSLCQWKLRGQRPERAASQHAAFVMSGEPFGIAQTLDGTAIVVTSDSDTTASVLSSGIPASSAMGPSQRSLWRCRFAAIRAQWSSVCWDGDCRDPA